jgi:hypothetical protein
MGKREGDSKGEGGRERREEREGRDSIETTGC